LIKHAVYEIFYLTICYRSSWVKSGDGKCKIKNGSLYEDCKIELEWISSDTGSLDSGTLIILNSDGVTSIVCWLLRSKIFLNL